MSIIDKARKLRRTIENLAISLDDENAMKNVELFETWKADTDYTTGDRVRYNETLYKCLQSHTSLTTWTPDTAVSLWTQVLIPDPEQIYDWEQPDSTNPYMKGDKVRHNDKTWVSDIDNNVWEPGVYGWSEI